MNAPLSNAGIPAASASASFGQQVRDQVLAGRVDDVEQDDEQRDEPQIAAAEHQAETRCRLPAPAAGAAGAAGLAAR